MALTESEILRRHTFYQTSYIGPRPEKPNLSPTISPRKSLLLKGRTEKQKTRDLGELKCKNIVKSAPPPKEFETAAEALDYRRNSRSNRARPWREETPKPHHKCEKVQLFYDRTLPKQLDTTQLKMKSRKYVSNTKYGNIYEIRIPTNTPRSPTPPTYTYIWEDDYLLWLNGTRDKYIEDLTSRSKAGETYGQSPTSSNSTARPDSQQSRRQSLPGTKEKGGRPSAEIYTQYNSHRLEKARRKSSAVLIQKAFRGWYVRSFIKKLKRKALLEHGKTFLKFVEAYKEIVTRIQRRYGVTKTSCSVDLRQINTFMDNKLKYEAAFKKLAVDDKLSKDDLMDFFNLCELWPTRGEINRSFDIVFKGYGNTAEVIFLLDCSVCIDIVGFYNVIQFIKDVVQGLDISPDRTRVGVIPYNEDAFSSFGITAFTNKSEVLEAISKIKIRLGLTRTDVALQLMLQMFKESRPGAQNIGIVITDGKSNYPEKTEQEAKQAHEAGVTMFVIGVGTKADVNEIHAIATSPKHIFTAANPRSLSSIRARLETRFCLAACSFCCYLLPRIARFGLLMSEALDILWTTYPPAAANIGVEKYLTVKILDDKIRKATNLKACLQLVIQSKLQRNGFITVPSAVREGIERITSEEEALKIVEDFIENSKMNARCLDSQ